MKRSAPTGDLSSIRRPRPLGRSSRRPTTSPCRLSLCAKKAGITQVELAERTGISQADISRIERGTTSPTAKTLQRIAEALNAEVRLVAKTA